MKTKGLKACAVILLTVLLSINLAFGDSADVELEKIVVTPSSFAQELQTVPASITVINAAQIQDSNAQSTADLLRAQTGLLVRDYYGNGTKVAVDLRGFGETAGNNTLVLIDGRRVNEIDLSGTDWTQIPLDRIESIEILRGAGAVLYGDNASGGVINIITKRGKGRPQIEFESIAGSYQMEKQKLSLSGLSNKLSYFLTSTQQSTNGYRQNSYYNAQDFFSKLIYDFNDRLSLGLTGSYHSADYGLPGALRESQLRSCSRRDSKFIDDDAGEQDWYVLLDTKIKFSEHNEFILPVSFRRRYMDTYWGTGGYGTNSSRIDTLGICPKVRLKSKLFKKDNLFTLGLDFYKIDSLMNDFSSFGIQTGDADVDKNSIGGYLANEFLIRDNLIFNLGYRYERANYTFNYTDFSGFFADVNDAAKFSEKVFQAGIAYNYKKGSKLYLNVSQNFRLPVTEEFMLYNFSFFPFGRQINKNLLPQEAINYEIGLNHRFSTGWEVGIGAFLMKIKNEIYYNPISYINENYAKTQHRGLEINWSWDILKDLNLESNYTFTDAFFVQGAFNKNQIPAVPRHKASLGLKWRVSEKLQLNTLLNYTGRQYFISDQAHDYSPMGDFATFDAKISYKFSQGLFFVGINNLFDEKYSEYGAISVVYHEKGYYPSSGRNFILGGSLKF